MTQRCLETDVVVIGAGFGGSLTALLCDRLGLSVVLIERGTHPRFAIGESSTPLANLILADLARRYDLPRLLPLTKYGPWRRTYPAVARGLKRGFSYFHHRRGEPFVPRPDHANELLVTASPNDEQGDTHWFRADVDHFFIKEVQAAGIPYFDETVIEKINEHDGWRITGQSPEQQIETRCRFIVDASGDGGALRRALQIGQVSRKLRTNSRAVFGHFEQVERWDDVYRAATPATPARRLTGAAEHPFPCDAAALHHVFDGGWMWVLRFDNGITSAGFVLDGNRAGLQPYWDTMSPTDAWVSMMRRFPSIARQFHRAKPVRPLVKTGRLQRVCERLAGDSWVMLPYTAGFIDPLHSPGNALTLLGVERLVRILTDGLGRPRLREQLVKYERLLRRDQALLDLIIHGCFASFSRFELMSTFAMFYFAGAHTAELRRRAGDVSPDDGFLLSHDDSFVAAVRRAHADVSRLAGARRVTASELEAYCDEVRGLIEPYNRAGLCDRSKHNLYLCT